MDDNQVNTIIDLAAKREEHINRDLSTHMALDLLEDTIKDLKTFENMEEIQEAIKFLYYTKAELRINKLQKN